MNWQPIIVALMLASPTDLGIVGPGRDIEIVHCHPGDRATIHVVGHNQCEDFTITNAVLTLKDISSMIPSGTNTFEIRSVCRGMTGEVSVVTFEIVRIPAPRVRRRRTNPPAIPAPPSPTGLVMALPGGTNDTYGDYVKRQASGKRRSE